MITDNFYFIWTLSSNNSFYNKYTIYIFINLNDFSKHYILHYIYVPKIYSIDTKLSLINFYNSDIFTIANALHIFNISKSTLYNKQLLCVSNNRSTYKSKISPSIHKYIVTYVIKKVSFNIKKFKKIYS